MKTIDILLAFLVASLLAGCDGSKLSEGRYDITLIGKCLPGDSDNSFIFDGRGWTERKPYLNILAQERKINRL